MSQILLGMDFGGTKLTAGLAGEDQLLARDQCPTPAGAGPRRVFEEMVRLARSLREDLRPAGVGISFGGPVDPARKVVRICHHLPDWEGIPLSLWAEEEFGAPALMDNDANAAALGEHHFGAGRGCDHLLHVNVGTGIGGGIVLHSQVYQGATGMAGEIGHMVVLPGGPLCTCGRHGCLEALASGPAIARDARERLEREPDRGQRMLSLAGGDPERITARIVSEAAAQGDELAQDTLDQAAEMLGLGIANAINLINPQRVTVGGGVVKIGPAWMEKVRAAAQANSLSGCPVEIVLAELGDDSPLWGAIALAEAAAMTSRPQHSLH
ncbi:MAG: ROK family protein [Chloroflexota bacterium]|nr:ROK family protein [Chloroflexota bacterium]